MKHIAVNIKQYLPFGSVVWMGRTAFVEEKKRCKIQSLQQEEIRNIVAQPIAP